MAYRTIDLSGTYLIASLTADTITLVDPQLVNPNWYYANLDGAGTTGYDQNISIEVLGAAGGLDLGGSYTIASVSPTQLVLSNPEDINAAWNMLALLPGLQTGLLSSYVSTNRGNWIGPFIVEGGDTSLLVANFVGLQGLFKDNGKKQQPFPIAIELEATPVDSDDDPIGAPQTFSITIEGNTKGRDSRAATMLCQLATPGRQSVRARRLTNADYDYDGTVVDEVKWKDLYGISAVDLPNFGNVTTVHTRTYATEGALNLKERKLNLLASRLVPRRISGTNFTAPQATQNAADILTAMCLDPYIGGRALAELDLDSIYGAVAEAVAYFGADDAGRFNYTFDDDQTSFEDSVAIVAQAVFSTAFRQGNKIKLELERETEDSVLLFNHRNKVPGSETRSISMGRLDDNDGVEVEYTSPDDDTPATLYIPADRSAKKPRSIKALGVRSHMQAYWIAWRAWNKIEHQHGAVQFTALQEAATIIRTNRVRVADNTRNDTQDGEIEAQDGLELELSQPVEFAPGKSYTIFLQLPDASVEAMPVAPGSSVYHVVLARAPRIALAIGDDLNAQATYQIVPNDSPREAAFLIAEKEPEDTFTYSLKAINYSPLYYANDRLTLWVTFDDYSPADRSAWINDGIYQGGAAVVSDPDRGLVYQGGLTQWISLPDMPPRASYTIAVWVLPTQGSAIKSIFGMDSAGGVDFSVTDAGVALGHGGSVLFASIPAETPPIGGWTHLAATYDGEAGLATLYRDGRPIKAGAIGAVSLSGLMRLFQTRGGQHFTGRASEIRFYPVTLEPAAILALWRTTRLGSGESVPTADPQPGDNGSGGEGGGGEGGEGGGGTPTPPPPPPPPPTGVTMTISPPSSTTSSSKISSRLAQFTVTVSGAVPDGYVWGVEEVSDGSASVTSGQGTAQAYLRVVADENTTVVATFYCDAIIAGMPYRAVCYMAHTFSS